MLRTLRIRDLVILEDVTVEFGDGLNLLTGETGAGKSILVDALGLAVGARADRSLIRSGEERAIVEALFRFPEDSAVAEWIADRGLADLDDGELLVRREIAAGGSNRISLNGSPCTLGLLRELGERIFELHGQHEHQSLLSPERHLEMLDRFGGHEALLDEVGAAFAAYRECEASVAEMRSRAAKRHEEMARIEESIRRIEGLDPQPGELERLDTERRVLQNAARVVELLDTVVAGCYEGEGAAASLAARVSRSAAELADLDPELADPARRLEAAAVELQDVGEAFRDYRDRRAFDPDRLEQLEGRRVELSRLCLEFGEDEEAVLSWRDEARVELAGLRNVGEALEQSAAELERRGRRYTEAAGKLGIARQRAANRLVPAMTAQFEQLALGNAKIDVAFSPRPGPPPGEPDEGELPLNARGAESAEFMLAANPGEPMRPLARVGSGGELSRILLAMHAAIGDAGDRRILVFDEVDTGVGGAVADAVGSRLARLARRHQVLCVTHLPQVAAHANRHLVVSKETSGGRTRAGIENLGWDDRVEELARMLGGKQTTEAARGNAQEMLASAGRSRPGRPRRKSRTRVSPERSSA